MIKRNTNTSTGKWAESEFGLVNFGDIRLSKKLLKTVNRFADSPERSINQACEDWHQSKTAYRFFQDGAISERKILDRHIIKTVERAKITLNYFSYPRHELYFI